jgi:hypothetical protein
MAGQQWATMVEPIGADTIRVDADLESAFLALTATGPARSR